MTNLRDLRERAALSQEELAHRAGITRNHYNLIEQGKHTPRLDTAQAIALVLGVSVDEIWPAMPAAANE